MPQIAKMLMVLGGVLLLAGVVMLLSSKLPWLGRLPGDIVIEKKNFSLYIPLATSILVSLVLTLLFWLFGRR